MRSIELFPVTVFQTQVENNNLLKSVLVKDILNSVENLKIPETWTTDKILTSFTEKSSIIQDNKSLLEKTYLDSITEIFDREVEVDIKNIWYNVYLNGEYQEEHDHLGGIFNQAHFSFIHFLCYDERDHKPPEFRDPLSQLRNLSLELDSNNWGEVYVPKIREGDLLMFPSYLQHSVPAGKKTSYPRITLSFNVSVTRYGEDTRSN